MSTNYQASAGDLAQLDFLRVGDRSGSEIDRLLTRADEMRGAWMARMPPQWCAGRRVAFIWDGEGFRNRAAFELGVAEAGGIGVEIPGALGEREAIADLAGYLDNWFDAIVVRTPSFDGLNELAACAEAPVVNARTFHNHPCEILGDLAFVHHLRGTVNDLKVVFAGEATNLCRSWCEAAAVLDIEVVQACPEGYEVEPSWLASLSPTLPARVSVCRALDEAIADADVVYTDCWPAPDESHDRAEIARAFGPLRVTAELLALAPRHALFLPCPPVTRGEEVSGEAMDDPRCRVIEAKAWLLHAQNALLADVLAKTSAKVRPTRD